MKNTKLLITFSLVSIVMGCNRVERQNNVDDHETMLTEDFENFEVVNAELSSDKIDFASFIESVKLGFIETNDEKLIGKIYKVEVVDSLFFLSEKRALHCVYQGRIIYTIKSIGKGKGEFLNITDFFVSKEEGILTIYDGSSYQKFIDFELKSGEYLSERRGPNFIPSYSLQPFGDEYYIHGVSNMFWGEKGLLYNVLITNSEGKSLSYHLRIPWPLVNVKSTRFPIYKSGEGTYTVVNANDRSIYKVDYEKKIMKKEYEFNFGDQNLNVFHFDDTNRPQLTKGYNDERTNHFYNEYLEESEEVFGPIDFFETQTHLVFSCFNSSGELFGVYNKKLKQTNFHERYVSIVPGFSNMFSDVKGVYKDRFISIAYPGEIYIALKKVKEHIGTVKYKELLNSNAVIKQFDSIDPNNNPVLVFTKYK